MKNVAHLQNIINNSTARRHELVDCLFNSSLENNSIIADSFTESEDMCENDSMECTVRYFEPLCEEENPDSAEIILPKKEQMELLPIKSRVYAIPLNEIVPVGDSFEFGEYALYTIHSLFPEFFRNVSKRFGADLTQNISKQPDGNASSIISSAGIENSPIPLWQIERVYRDSGFVKPIIISSDPYWYELRDKEPELKKHIYYSHEFDELDKEMNNVLSFDGNSLKVITSVRTTDVKISVPRCFDYGIRIRESISQPEWHIQFVMYYKIFIMKLPMDINGIFHFKSCKCDSPTDTAL